MISKIDQDDIDDAEEVSKLKKETFHVDVPTLDLALKFLSEAPKLNIDDYEELLFLQKPEYFDLNRIHKFSQLTPYSLLKTKNDKLTTRSYYGETTFNLFYYLREKGYSVKTILRINPFYIKYVSDPSPETYLFYLKRIKNLGMLVHKCNIHFIKQSVTRVQLVDEDIRLLENKIKILNAIGST